MAVFTQGTTIRDLGDLESIEKNLRENVICFIPYCKFAEKVCTVDKSYCITKCHGPSIFY